MTPVLTAERSAAGHRPDARQQQLIASVRGRDAAGTARQLEAWVHRRGLASLHAFRHGAVPGLLSAADDAWLEACLQQPLEQRMQGAEAAGDADTAAAAAAAAPTAWEPSGLAAAAWADAEFAGASSPPEPVQPVLAAEPAIPTAPAPGTADMAVCASAVLQPQQLSEPGALDAWASPLPAAAGEPLLASNKQPSAAQCEPEAPVGLLEPEEQEPRQQAPSLQAQGLDQPLGFTTAGARAEHQRSDLERTDRQLGDLQRDEQTALEPAANPELGGMASAPWSSAPLQASDDHGAWVGLTEPLPEWGDEPLAALTSDASTAAASPPAAAFEADREPQGLLAETSSLAEAPSPSQEPEPDAWPHHGPEPGLASAGAVLADAPQRLRRKLFGSIGKARVLMRACFEEAISTLQPHAEADRQELEEQPEPGAPTVAAPNQPPAHWPEPDTRWGQADRSANQPASSAPEPDGTAPMAAWSRSLGTPKELPSFDMPLQGPPAPAPAALADLRGWLPGSSAGQDRRVS